MDIRKTIADWRQGMNLLGLMGDQVNWQSIVVLLANKPDAVKYIVAQLARESGGWATYGHSEDSSGTSLYLSPKGMVYWLRYGGHTQLYHNIMRASQDKLDRAGWLHISGGRVDVYCRMTPQQKRWLENNLPHEESENARDIDGVQHWQYYDPREHSARDADWVSPNAPVPYAKAEPYDVRPVTDIDADWDRLLARIDIAQQAGREGMLAE